MKKSSLKKKTGAEALRFFHLANAAALATDKVLTSPDAIRMIQCSNEFADAILDTMGKAKSVEQLIRQEQTLQEIDEINVQTDGDRASVRFAQSDYAQLALVVQQIRDDPKGYIHSNMSIKETRGNYQKLPKSRGPQQIRANKERLSDRAAFLPKELRAVWNARIKLADKTEDMLRALHQNIVANYETAQNIDKQLDEQKSKKRDTLER